MVIMCSHGIPCDFTWCSLADIAKYPQFRPLVHHDAGPYSVVRFP